MGLPTITRAILFREDWLTATGAQTWTLDSGVTITSDGDVATIGGLSSTNGATANTGATGTSTASTTLTVRAYTSSATSFDLKLTFNDASTQTLTFNFSGTTRLVTNFSVTSGKNLNLGTVKLLNAVPSLATVFVDFIQLYKELLTLPTAIRPLQEQ